MSKRHSVSRPWLAAVALVALAVAFAWPIARDGWTQSAHYALVRAMSDGTARIDPYVSETGDISYWDGHYFSSKAPGVAALALPLYVPLERAGLWPDDRRAQLWLLTLWAAVACGLLLVLLLRAVAERLDRGSGLVAALALAVTSMVLPFSTLLFSHLAGALLVFTAFWLLLREGAESRRGAVCVAAGGIAGAAVLVEYQTALAGLVLAGYAAATAAGRARAGALYALGFLAGAAPLAAYNWWAFGNPTHMSVVNAVEERGASGHDVVGAHGSGLFGVTRPSLAVFENLLLEDRGLLVATPVVAACCVGVVLLWLRGRRAEAATIGAIGALYPLYNAGVTSPFGGPFGGESPGPRYLITILPFLYAPLGLAYRRAPGVVLGLGALSFATMAAATATRPAIEGHQVSEWWTRLRTGAFTDTAPGLLGATGAPRWLLILPFGVALAVVVSVLVSEAARLRRPTSRDAVAAAVAIVAWYLVLKVSRRIDLLDPRVAPTVTFAMLAATGAVAVAITRSLSRRPSHGHAPSSGNGSGR